MVLEKKAPIFYIKGIKVDYYTKGKVGRLTNLIKKKDRYYLWK
jgi:hypothetical protein